MDSRFNILLHGSAEDAAALLSGDDMPSASDADRQMIYELQAALTNALQRIDQLGKWSSKIEGKLVTEITRLENQIELLGERTEGTLSRIADYIERE